MFVLNDEILMREDSDSGTEKSSHEHSLPNSGRLEIHKSCEKPFVPNLLSLHKQTANERNLLTAFLPSLHSMETEVSRTCSSEYDDDTKALNALLDIFSSRFDLKEIATAFCKAGRNFEAASEILTEINGYSSCASTTGMCNGESKAVVLSEELSENISKTWADRTSKTSKPRKQSFTVGTVSGVIGKGYSKPTTLLNGSNQIAKPVKVNLNEFPVDETGDDVLLDSTTSKIPIKHDVEEFLYKMLGEGFQLGMDVIHDVLGSCGYDASKSIEKLADLSASTLNRSDDIVGGVVEKNIEKSTNLSNSTQNRNDDITGGFAEKYAGKGSELEYPLRIEKPQNSVSSRRNAAKLVSQKKQKKQKNDLSRELLISLFNAPDRPEKPPRKPPVVRSGEKSRSYETIVSEPLVDRTPTSVTDILGSLQDTDKNVEDEGDYQVLRRVAKEHWVTMKEYYKTAIDAFTKGNQILANELLEKGQFFHKKAREADEKSSQKIFECSGTKENLDEVVLDLHEHGTSQAMRLLKIHLTTLSGSIQKLKVIVETTGEDITKSVKRRRVVNYLEQKCIKWTEEEAGTIIVQLVEPENEVEELSFA